MELLSRLIIGKKSKNPEKRDIIWNMAGSFLYAFASMVLSIAVVQIAGEDAGGIFTFAFTTFGQHMFMMAYFGIRPFQITDTGGKYSFGDYLGLRLLTCGAAVLTGMGYVFLNGYSFEKAAVVFLMVVYKVIDALADAYEAEFQRGGRLYLTGKSNAFRTILSVGVFLASLAYTKDLAAASLWAVGAQAAGFLVFDVLVIRELPNVEWRSANGKKQELFAETILLFCSAVLDFYIFSASKYAIEGCMADRDMAVFGAIFMPTSIINLVAGFVIRPYLTKMSFTWEMGRTRRFLKIQKRIALIIAALTVLAVGGAWILGIPVLSLLYPNLRTGLSQCRPALVLIIFGGALNAYMNLFYYSLVIMKKQKYIFGVYGLVSLMAVLVSTPFVRWGGIFGGALAYVVLTGALMVLFGLIDLAGILEHKRKNPEQRNLE
ncbi:lipopolysaccharide biosynthesis protein [Alitiscatomonas sp.]|uniref:lipopolysaccharide biosynthesis protein n=1 Tax=Alitiscatomonas sp. TaxID=2981647 RepID=UPI0030778314